MPRHSCLQSSPPPACHGDHLSSIKVRFQDELNWSPTQLPHFPFQPSPHQFFFTLEIYEVAMLTKIGITDLMAHVQVSEGICSRPGVGRKGDNNVKVEGQPSIFVGSENQPKRQRCGIQWRSNHWPTVQPRSGRAASPSTGPFDCEHEGAGLDDCYGILRH